MMHTVNEIITIIVIVIVIVIIIIIIITQHNWLTDCSLYHSLSLTISVYIL
jgi:preprotein translocase subunit SecE